MLQQRARRVLWCASWLVLAAAVPARAQTPPALDAIARRLDEMDRENAALRAELRALRSEIERLTREQTSVDEQVDLQAGRISEQEQVKAQTTQRVPVRFTGALLFSLFRNSENGVNAGVDYPVTARPDAAPAAWSATLRRTIVGVEFQTPQAMLGGQFRGSVFTDFTEAGDQLTNIQPRLRTASIEGRWNRFAVMVGQDKPIFSVRDPTSLAQVQFAPLTAAGNFWLYRPQVRVEQTVPVGSRGEFRARIGVSQTPETIGAIPLEGRASLDPRRPAFEGHFQIAYQADEVRRIEIGSGFHRSTTQVLNAGVPADLISLDWFVKPWHWAELTGTIFTGENLSKGGSSAVSQGFALVPVSPGVFRPVPVARSGGWAQLTVVPTPRLTINVHGGIDRSDNDFLLPTSLTRNTAFMFNTFYRIAPNVLWGFEIGHITSEYRDGQRPSYIHHDIHVAYLF
jgi:hypothetical protein